MNSPATKNEADFDNLLGQLVDELAMTPASKSGVALVPEPEPEPEARVESTGKLAADAAAAAGVVSPAAAGPSNATVKVVGILAGSLTAIAVAALVVFGMNPEPSETAPAVAQDDSAERAERLSEAAAAHRVALEQAQAQSMAAERAEIQAHYVRVEAAHLEAELEAQKAKKNKPRRTWRRTTPKPGDDFDKL